MQGVNLAYPPWEKVFPESVIREDEVWLSEYLAVLSEFLPSAHSPWTRICDPGSHLWWEILLEYLNLTPQTQRLSITVQKVSINLCRYYVTEGSGKIFWRLLGLYLPPSSSFFFFFLSNENIYLPLARLEWFPGTPNSSLTNSWINILYMRFISIPNSFLLHLNKEKNTFIFLKKKKKKRSFEKVMGWEINVRELLKFLRFSFDPVLSLDKSLNIQLVDL